MQDRTNEVESSSRAPGRLPPPQLPSPVTATEGSAAADPPTSLRRRTSFPIPPPLLPWTDGRRPATSRPPAPPPIVRTSSSWQPSSCREPEAEQDQSSPRPCSCATTVSLRSTDARTPTSSEAAAQVASATEGPPASSPPPASPPWPPAELALVLAIWHPQGVRTIAYKPFFFFYVHSN